MSTSELNCDENSNAHDTINNCNDNKIFEELVEIKNLIISSNNNVRVTKKQCKMPRCDKTDHSSCEEDFKKLRSERSKRYYAERKNQNIVKEKMKCPCGGEYGETHKNKHLTTSKHKDYVFYEEHKKKLEQLKQSENN